jgi:hypothetical protein
MNSTIKKNHSITLEDYIAEITYNCEQKMITSKKNKIEDENLSIPTIHNYNEFTNYNYNVQQLKSFAKFYKLKMSGNKKELITRIFVYLKLSFYITKIQKIFRGFIQRKWNKLFGPACNNRKICTNNTDFITMDDLNDLATHHFFSYKDIDGFIYGFDIASLFNLLFKSNKCPKHITNPYNRNVIPDSVFKNVKSLIRISKIIGIHIELDSEDVSNQITNEKMVELRTLSLFQNIDSLGNYSDPKWFLSLSRHQLIKLIRELLDIWNYRAQLSNEIKRSICPPHGDPFRNFNMHFVQTENDLVNVKKVILEVLEKFVTTGVDNDSKTLGAYYVLGSLTLVNPVAASAVPWLFQSFTIF